MNQVEQLKTQLNFMDRSNLFNGGCLGSWFYSNRSYLFHESNVFWREAMKKHNASLTPVSDLVQEVLEEKFKKQSYPENITDQVCLAIEENSAWHNRYKRLVESYSKWSVNSQIGRSTLQLTGLKNLGLRATATSSLIKTYTRLG
jgi:hypothetical protein